MKQQLIRFAAVTALASGMIFAQAPAPSPNPQARPHNFIRQHMAQIAQQLNLTDAQKQQAKMIFQQARQTAQPVREQLKQNRQALVEAAKAGNGDAAIQQLAARQGNLLGQMVAVRTEAFAKFYATLTPEQRTKAEQLEQQFQQRRLFRQHSNG
jgi:Spy/CpxP family protein refolding chaperone